MRVRHLIGILLLAVAVSASPASAAVIEYNSAAAWQAAVVGVSTITFEENGPGSFTYYGGAASFSGINFSSLNIYTVDPGYYFAYDLGSGDVLSAQQGSTSLGISGLNSKAVGFDLGVWVTQNLTITLSTGDVINRGMVGNVPGFFGVTSDTAITGLTIDFVDLINIDNFSTARDVTVAPEPASMLLLGMGLAGAGYARRRARR